MMCYYLNVHFQDQRVKWNFLGQTSASKMWSFSEVSGNTSASSGCGGAVSGSTKPSAHPEDWDGFCPRIAWKPSHLEAAVCPKKFHCLLYISSPLILIIVPFFFPSFPLALFLHYHASFFLHLCTLVFFSFLAFILVFSLVSLFSSVWFFLYLCLLILYQQPYLPSCFSPFYGTKQKKETYRSVSNFILCPVQRGNARLSKSFSPLTTTCLTHELRAILAPAGILG